MLLGWCKLTLPETVMGKILYYVETALLGVDMALPHSVHIANVLYNSKQKYLSEPRFLARKGKQARYLGARGLYFGAKKARATAVDHLSGKLANKLIRDKHQEPVGIRATRYMEAKMTDLTDLTEVWGIAARIATSIGARSTARKLSGEAAAGTAKTLGRAVKADILRNKAGRTVVKNTRRVAKKVTAASNAVKNSKAYQFGKKKMRRMEARARLDRMRMGKLQHEKPIQAAIKGFGRDTVRDLTIGTGTTAVQRAIDHKVQQKQEQRWADQERRIQQVRRPYQESTESGTKQFTPSEMGAAQDTYKKNFGNHNLANAHIANLKLNTKFDPKKAQKLPSLNGPTKTGTKVSEQVRACANNLYEVDPVTAATMLPTAVKIGFAPHRAIKKTSQAVNKAVKNKLNPVHVGKKIGKAIRGR